MLNRTLLVVGAAGDVGQGLVAQGLQADRKVVAAGRDGVKLERVMERFSSETLACVQGDVGSEASALLLWEAATAAFGGIDEVVISINAVGEARSLDESSARDLEASFTGNVLPHFCAAKTFLPRLPEDGMLIGIGGGTADFIFPGLVAMSMSQAALRMLYTGLSKEGAQVRELIIASMVVGESNRNSGRPEWITDDDVGRHVCSILDEPSSFPKPIQYLRSRGQVGMPEAAK